MAASRRTGDGAYLNEWRFPAPDAAAHTPTVDEVVELILDWCRETLGQMRRPWGIGEFDLAIAVARSGDRRPASLSLRRIAPTELYGAGAALDAVRRLLEAPRDAASAASPVHVAVALFSWGDAAHAALPAAQPGA